MYLQFFFCILTNAIIYVLIHHIIVRLYLYFLNILYFFKYFCTNIFHRRSLYTFYLRWSLRARVWPSARLWCWHFAIDFVSVSCPVSRTPMWNQHFPRPYVVSGKFTQISIAEVFFSFWGFRKAQLLSYGDLLVVCEVPKMLLDARLRIVGVLQGGANQVGSGCRCWSIWCLYTWILSRPRRHVIEI